MYEGNLSFVRNTVIHSIKNVFNVCVGDFYLDFNVNS